MAKKIPSVWAIILLRKPFHIELFLYWYEEIRLMILSWIISLILSKYYGVSILF